MKIEKLTTKHNGEQLDLFFEVPYQTANGEWVMLGNPYQGDWTKIVWVEKTKEKLLEVYAQYSTIPS